MGRTSAITNLLFAMSPLGLGIVFAMIASLDKFQGVALAMVLATASLVALLKLKLPILRQGRLVNFGPNQAGRNKRWLWWLAFTLLCLAILVGAVAVRPQ